MKSRRLGNLPKAVSRKDRRYRREAGRKAMRQQELQQIANNANQN
jgi:hypothetical protein